MFKDFAPFYLLKEGIIKKRLFIIEDNINKHCGCALVVDLESLKKLFKERDSDSNPLVLTGLSSQYLSKHVRPKSIISKLRFVNVNWVIDCTRGRKLIPLDDYIISVSPPSTDISVGRHQVNDISQQESGSNDVLKRIQAHPHWSHNNDNIIEQFEKMADMYSIQRLPMKALSYRKAIANIKALKSPIMSEEEAKAIPGIGAKLAGHIAEILASGEIQKLKAFEQRPELKTLSRFAKLMGVGPTIAKDWMAKGYKEPKDLLTAGDVKLTESQRLGIIFEEELQERMTRKQVEFAHEKFSTALSSASPTAKSMIVGSYLRAKSTVGDVDLLAYDLTIDCVSSAVELALDQLRKDGFITHSLSKETLDGNGRYMGICLVDGKHRRIDIWIIDEPHLGAGLINWTGNELFVRSLRNIAKTKNLKLTGLGLEDRTTGALVAYKTEEDIFDALGLPYVAPKDRNY